MIMVIMINMLMAVQQNSVTHLRVLLALTDRGIVVVVGSILCRGDVQLLQDRW
jgi:hypothetical protein